MEGWIDLGSDATWEVYGGLWGKKAPDGSWFVVEFVDLETEGAGRGVHACVMRVDLSEVPGEKVRMALAACGLSDDREITEEMEVEALVRYGVFAPLRGVGGKRADRVRAQAIREAEFLMANPNTLAKVLERPVSRIGTTAREVGQGDIFAGLRHYVEEGKIGSDPTMDLMIKIMGGGMM